MNSPWPVAILRIDLVGSLSTRKGGVKFVIIVVEYFTRCAEAEPMNIVTSKKALDFVIKNIMCRYGIPCKIVSDNGKEFDSDQFNDFSIKHGIIKSFLAVAKLQANGQVEVVNKIFKTALNKKLQACKAHWPKEHPRDLWAYKTIEKTSTRHTPYSMTHGCEAVILVESIVPPHMTET
uniref:Integrase catalytic domain-containing protein n=1 Tax=Cannabis sativa TaxID=3483 RepID=A0A803QH62_CANSA